MEVALHDGSLIALEIQGDGPAILLPVNPAPIEGQQAEEMRRWGADPALGRNLIDGLRDRYRVIAFDYEGHVQLHPKPGTLTPDHIAADFLAIADAAGAERFAYYGYSWLALSGLQLAIRTDRLSALVMGGYPPIGGPYKEMLAVTLAANEMAKSMAGGKTDSDDMANGHATKSEATRQATASSLAKSVATIQESASSAVADNELQSGWNGPASPAPANLSEGEKRDSAANLSEWERYDSDAKYLSEGVKRDSDANLSGWERYDSDAKYLSEGVKRDSDANLSGWERRDSAQKPDATINVSPTPDSEQPQAFSWDDYDWSTVELPMNTAQTEQFVTLYEQLQAFDDRTVQERIRCPRLCFTGSVDRIEYGAGWGEVTVDIVGPLVRHREELKAHGWDVRVLDGLDHTSAMQAANVLPLLRPWLDALSLEA
ncbi:alpha/beta fold hydrolase [Cohnella thailandensis]|uniref:alpha/beta fold hydrolase n=1 Tax=Cohnella thailandensis TaxID=557557 RepID=UPI001C871932|nr:alpha/beta hydrolase [Cohnella thailandensis]MBP1975810.1 pimeloyl-ACP methyl ester carboxylesterase [Cohnella thailandensis]